MRMIPIVAIVREEDYDALRAFADDNVPTDPDVARFMAEHGWTNEARIAGFLIRFALETADA